MNEIRFNMHIIWLMKRYYGTVLEGLQSHPSFDSIEAHAVEITNKIYFDSVCEVRGGSGSSNKKYEKENFKNLNYALNSCQQNPFLFAMASRERNDESICQSGVDVSGKRKIYLK